MPAVVRNHLASSGQGKRMLLPCWLGVVCEKWFGGRSLHLDCRIFWITTTKIILTTFQIIFVNMTFFYLLGFWSIKHKSWIAAQCTPCGPTGYRDGFALDPCIACPDNSATGINNATTADQCLCKDCLGGGGVKLGNLWNNKSPNQLCWLSTTHKGDNNKTWGRYLASSLSPTSFHAKELHGRDEVCLPWIICSQNKEWLGEGGGGNRCDTIHTMSQSNSDNLA